MNQVNKNTNQFQEFRGQVAIWKEKYDYAYLEPDIYYLLKQVAQDTKIQLSKDGGKD